jgi:hypothetical protein
MCHQVTKFIGNALLIIRFVWELFGSATFGGWNCTDYVGVCYSSDYESHGRYWYLVLCVAIQCNVTIVTYFWSDACCIFSEKPRTKENDHFVRE